MKPSLDSNSFQNFNEFLSDFQSHRKSDDSVLDDPLTSFKAIVDIDVQNKIDSLYEEFLSDARSEPILSLYQRNFEYFYQTIKALIENEEKLKNIIESQQNHIQDMNIKCAQALKLSTTDQQTIAKLRLEVENAWRTSHIASQKEKRTRETVSAMKLEISNLTKLVEQGVGLTMGQEYNMHQILKENEELSFNNAKLTEELEVFRRDVGELRVKEEKFDHVINESVMKIKFAEEQISALKIELQQENRKIEKMTEEIKIMKGVIHSKETEIVKMDQIIGSARDENFQYNLKNKELQASIDKIKKEIETQTNRIQKLQSENDQIGLRNEALIDDNQQLNKIIKMKEAKIETLKSDIAGLHKQRDSQEKKIKQLDEQIKEINSARQIENTERDALKKELNEIKKHKSYEKAIIDKLRKDRDERDTKIQAAQNQAKEWNIIKRDHQKEIKYLGEDISDLKHEIEKLKGVIVYNEKEILHKNTEINKMTQQMVEVIEEIKLKEESYSERDKKLNDIKLKLENMVQMYESVRSDRNLTAKELIEMREDKETLQKEVIVLKNQQHLLQTSKIQTENDLKKLKLEYKTIEKNRDYLKLKLDQTQRQMKVSQDVANNLENGRKGLINALANADSDTKRCVKEIEELIIERGILGSQLVRRNDEISLLYDKISLMKSILNRGEQMYAARISDIKILKKEILRLRKEVAHRNEESNLIEKLRNELKYSQTELLNEISKRKALEQLHENINIHPWRAVKACNPSKYELIVKVQELQKRLIKKSEEIAQLQIKFQEKDKIFIELKKHFAKQYPPKNLVQRQQVLEKQIKELKCLIAEYNIFNKMDGQKKTTISYI